MEVPSPANLRQGPFPWDKVNERGGQTILSSEGRQQRSPQPTVLTPFLSSTHSKHPQAPLTSLLLGYPDSGTEVIKSRMKENDIK